jgi:hypothetical protein
VPDRGAGTRLCVVCDKRPGTVKWADSAHDIVHGFYEWRCPKCAAREQLRHALKRALAIPALVWRSL